MADILLVFALKNLEIVFVQAGDQAVHGVRNRDRDENQANVDLQGLGMRLKGWIYVVGGIRTGRPHPRVNVDVIDWALSPRNWRGATEQRGRCRN